MMDILSKPQYVNSLRDKSTETNMSLQFISFLHTDLTKIVEILPHVRQGPTLFI